MIFSLFEEKKEYNQKDHLFIFMSFIYAIIVSKVFTYYSSSIINEDIYIPQLLITFIIFILTCETWWSVWKDKNKIDRGFFTFFSLLFLPIFIFISVFISTSDLMKNHQSFIENIYKCFIVLGGLFIYIILLKKYIRKLKILRLNNLWRLIPAILLFCLANLSCNNHLLKKDSFFIMFWTLFIMLFIIGFISIFLYANKYKNFRGSEEKMNKEYFIKKITPIAKLSQRYEFTSSIVIIGHKEDIFGSFIEKINKKIREYTIIFKGHDNISYIYIPYVKDDVEIKNILERIKKYNGDIISYGFSVKKYKFDKNIIDKINDCFSQISQQYEEAYDMYSSNYPSFPDKN